jgi:AraC-like DNA-binding protein
MSPSRTTGPAIADPPGRPQRDRRLGRLTAARSARPLRAPEGRVSLTRVRIGAQDLVVLNGTVDLRSVPRLLDVLQRVTGAGEPPALDLCRAGVPDAADVALVVHVVRWVCRRRPGLTIVCPPGPTRTGLERSGITATARIVGNRQALLATPTPTSHNAEYALVAPAAPLPKPRAGTSRRRAALLAEAIVAIEERYAEPDLALRDIARQIATSQRQLQRVFAQLAGSAFRDEVTAVRMRHGARLLHDTHMTVGEIARHVGYRQASQFTKAFRRFHGVTPTASVRRPG